MNTPRIGDTVHYTRGADDKTICRAALVTGHYRLPLIDLIEYTPDGRTTPRRGTSYDSAGAYIDTEGDTWASDHGFTPGTWHHIH